MASTSEVGHAKNVANFHDLISFCEGYGATYNPSKATLKIAPLKDLETKAQTNLAAIVPLRTAFNDAVNARIQAFEGLKPLATRLVNALQSTDATKEKIADAKTINKKIQGGRASVPKPPAAPDTNPPDSISSSQQSYDQLIQHFASLISVLQSEPSYTPNEADLQIATLNDRLTSITQKNQDISNAYTAVDNARIDRNDTLYNDTTGLVNRATDVKKYVKSIYGASSPQYSQVSGLKFSKVKV